MLFLQALQFFLNFLTIFKNLIPLIFENNKTTKKYKFFSKNYLYYKLNFDVLFVNIAHLFLHFQAVNQN